MKKLSLVFCALLAATGHAGSPTNPVFSGQYLITSCQPACDQIVAHLGADNQLQFAKSKALAITVIDKMQIA